MCTVTFRPQAGGYFLAMNRDEQRSRPSARPPRISQAGELRSCFPSEPSGGTWIGINERRIACALLNWTRPGVRVDPESPQSRGEIIPALLGETDSASVLASLSRLQLAAYRPFRLLTFLPGEARILQWQWDGQTPALKTHPWKMRSWFSSGYREQEVQQVRQTSAALFAPKNKADIRRLHRSHFPIPGLFSVCMHRTDARSVSYTEIDAGETIEVRYSGTSPCLQRPLRICRLELSNRAIRIAE